MILCREKRPHGKYYPNYVTHFKSLSMDPTPVHLTRVARENQIRDQLLAEKEAKERSAREEAQQKAIRTAEAAHLRQAREPSKRAPSAFQPTYSMHFSSNAGNKRSKQGDEHMQRNKPDEDDAAKLRIEAAAVVPRPGIWSALVPGT